MKGEEDRLWTSDADPVACLFQNKKTFQKNCANFRRTSIVRPTFIKRLLSGTPRGGRGGVQLYFAIIVNYLRITHPTPCHPFKAVMGTKTHMVKGKKSQM